MNTVIIVCSVIALLHIVKICVLRAMWPFHRRDPRHSIKKTRRI